MACLINSITELPKTLTENPFPTADQETFEEYGQNMVCVVNGEELEFFSADSHEGELAYASSDNDSDKVFITSILSGSDFILEAQGVGKFSTIESLTFCTKEVKPDPCVTPVCDEGKEPIVITPTTTKIGNEYAGTSDKSKPTGVPQYSIYLELDTCSFYYFNGYTWEEMPCHCDRVVGIPYSKKITVTANETARQNFIDFDHAVYANYVRTLFYAHDSYYFEWSAYTRPTETEWIFYSMYDDPFIINISSTYTGEPDEMTVTGDATVERDAHYDGHWIITVTGDCTITLKENPNP